MEKKLKSASFIFLLCFCLNTHGQNSYTGIISDMIDPQCIPDPLCYEEVYTLLTVSGTYIGHVNK